MVVKAARDANEVKFNFYTYDPTGRDKVIPIWAKDEDEAWEKFDLIYGKDTPVDKITKA
jgi:hypothetical protein